MIGILCVVALAIQGGLRCDNQGSRLAGAASPANQSAPPPRSILALETAAIVYRPIRFDDTRIKLTLEYIHQHYDTTATSICIVPQMIVVHWSGSETDKSVFEAFDPVQLPESRRELRAGGRVNVSAHFLVGRDGTVFQLMPENWMARHVIGLNRVSIGIENVGGPRHPLTPGQLKADAALIETLTQKYPTIQYLIGHFEYRDFRQTPLWEEVDPGYTTGKEDPGPLFMRQLRNALRHTHLRARWSP